jgi:hypothetical protein
MHVDCLTKMEISVLSKPFLLRLLVRCDPIKQEGVFYLSCRRVVESGVLSQVYATKNVIVLFQDDVISVGKSAWF